ncbi:winged helix-turn-helix domain-containing protein [Bacillus cytotoxicus]|uniref:Winged helix-turn-helix domain-containing protein n=1 Tax=Bacillus cytotoxicus TaxID=580165 RepID=A0ACC6AB53_9BACI|nr:winged helix-turn-helix domain-containing protein [Bacillus cytotoxicus]
MKRLTITNTHGLMVTDLRTQEKQESNAFFRTRIMAVRLVMQGKLGKEAAEICGIHRQSVSEYVKRFNEGGMDLLLERKMAPGRACFLMDDQQQALKEIILTSTPTDQGLGSAVSWTTPVIQEYLRRTYDVEMSTTGILRMLWRLKLSYTRPTYTLKKADSKKQRTFRHQITLIKKNC